jgi:hypothetical protein
MSERPQPTYSFDTEHGVPHYVCLQCQAYETTEMPELQAHMDAEHDGELIMAPADFAASDEAPSPASTESDPAEGDPDV